MRYDLVIKNGRVIDPAEDFDAQTTIAISNGKIATLNDSAGGNLEIDASGKIVCPGFVDIHSHVDNHLYSGQCCALQGITTTIGGNCGLSPQPPAVFFEQMQREGFPINQGQLVGHSFTLREETAITDLNLPATENQIERMVELAEERLSQGALGISFGLEYAPGSSYSEVLALCHLAARYSRPVAIHTRHDSWEGIRAIREAADLVRDSGVSLQISHLVYMVGMGMMKEALQEIELALNEGLNIAVDSGLYSAFATFIGSAVFSPGCLDKWQCDYDSLYIATGPYAHRQCTAELFTRLRRDEPDTVIVAFVGKEAEVVEALCKPYVFVSTDGAVGSPEPGSGHPQDSGTFPRFLRLMVRETGLLSFPDAIAKCTSQPARKMGLVSKGTLRPGSDADLVVFDPEIITDTSDYPGLGEPDSPPLGIEHVIVNGTPVVKNGQLIKDAHPGKAVLAF
jgi:N-acyl-D-amino-acid deacylase